MPRIEYINRKFVPSSQKIIDQACTIIDEYSKQGYDLTLRQLYYQFVSRDWMANKQSEYKRLGSIINDARLAGLIDWDSIVDRTRSLRSLGHWNSPKSILQSAAQSFRIDKWANQNNRVEVWIEKDALVGVIEDVCQRNDVPFFSCRGYTSQSEMWSAARRLLEYTENGQETIIIHLGDHDPSGIDMTNDIDKRLELFFQGEDPPPVVNRIALNMDQVKQYNPPPNPTKFTDSRAGKYVAEFGNSSWELDALEPAVLDQLIEDTILKYRDEDAWNDSVELEWKHIKKLKSLARNTD